MSATERLHKSPVNAAMAETTPKEIYEHLKTPEGQVARQAFLEGNAEEHSGENGRCIAVGCGGLIVKRVSGLCFTGYTYGIPHCSQCGRGYIFAGNVPTVGHDKFKKLMHTPVNF